MLSRAPSLAAGLLLVLIPFAAGAETLPRLHRAQPPPIPAQAAAGGEVLLEVEVGIDGRVGRTRVLRATPPYTELLTRATASWSFEPARDAERNEPIPSRVLVAGVFRGPEFYSGSTAGTPPSNVDAPSSDVAFPLSIVTPVYPPLARGDGVVILELEIDSEGQVREIRPLTSGTGFEQAAIDAARRWTFRPAQPTGERSGDGVVILVFGFRTPVGPS